MSILIHNGDFVWEVPQESQDEDVKRSECYLSSVSKMVTLRGRRYTNGNMGLHKGCFQKGYGHLGPIILGPSWAHLGASLGHLGRSWGDLGAILGPSWSHLGTILGHVWGHRRWGNLVRPGLWYRIVVLNPCLCLVVRITLAY